PRGIVLADRDRQHCIALVRVTGDEAELLDIGVLEARQGRGLGTALLAAAEDAAATLGARQMLLEVALDNDTARSLYDRAGYAEAGRRPAYYRRPGGGRMDALLLAKPLRPAP
ncbi:MAG: GNAT family N-acetyltransferase, partial [Pseudomonadota bacterium]